MPLTTSCAYWDLRFGFVKGVLAAGRLVHALLVAGQLERVHGLLQVFDGNSDCIGAHTLTVVVAGMLLDPEAPGGAEAGPQALRRAPGRATGEWAYRWDQASDGGRVPLARMNASRSSAATR